MPGEKILSECKPFYATSRRIIRYDERAQGHRIAEIAYDQLTAMELMRKPNHTMMILGTLGILATLFLTATGFIFVATLPALVGGAVLLFVGARGKLGYYQLYIRKTTTGPEANWAIGTSAFLDFLGLKTRTEEALWRLDYLKARSFIATIRNVIGELPER